MPEKKAQIILEVAQAIGNQLEMSELLASLNEALNPIVHFDAIAIVILEGDDGNCLIGRILKVLAQRRRKSVERVLWIVTHRASRLSRRQ